MNAQEATIARTLQPIQVLKVPIYQRAYSWTEERQLATFWSQIKEKADAIKSQESEVLSHYFGALILVPSKPVHGEVQTYNIVDGQQRLTTIMLCLSAFRQLARLRGFEQITLDIDSCLFNDGHGRPQIKLGTNAKDRVVFEDLMQKDKQGLIDKYHTFFQKNGALAKARVKEAKPFAAYWYFLEKAERYISDGSIDDERLVEEKLRTLTAALKIHFKFIVITLEETDDAQVIFETLNTGGEPLAAMDLVRNSIFQRATKEGPEVATEVELCLNEFHEKFWDREIKQGRLRRRAVDHYLTHALTAQTGREISITELYADYKRYQRYQEFDSAKQEAETLVNYTSVYRQLVEASGAMELSQLGRLFDDFEVGTAMPIVFVVATADIDDQEKNAIYDRLKSFIVRRAICELTTEGRNLFFAELARNLRKNEISVQYFCEELVRRTGPSRFFPDNNLLEEHFLSSPLYKSLRSKRVAYILYQIEAAIRDRYDEVETDLAPQMTVEHILPQDWQTHWSLSDGRKVPEDGLPVDTDMAEDMRKRSEALNRIGNLTLLTNAANSRISNLPFENKKKQLFNSSLLKLNQEIARELEWNEQSIDARSKRLFEIAKVIWPSVHSRDDEPV